MGIGPSQIISSGPIARGRVRKECRRTQDGRWPQVPSATTNHYLITPDTSKNNKNVWNTCSGAKPPSGLPSLRNFDRLHPPLVDTLNIYHHYHYKTCTIRVCELSEKSVYIRRSSVKFTPFEWKWYLYAPSALTIRCVSLGHTLKKKFSVSYSLKM
jgi:hypothetical protein